MSQYCPICDAPADLVQEQRELKLGRRRALVDHEFYRCPECGEEWYTPEQMDRVQQLAADRIRQEEGLLAPGEIQAIRESLELSQADFEKLLAFGPKTVGRWERGTVFQNQSSDMLMRVVRRFPEVARFLATRHDVELPRDGDWPAAPEKKLSEPGISEAKAFTSTRPVRKDIQEVFSLKNSGMTPLIIQVAKSGETKFEEASEAA